MIILGVRIDAITFDQALLQVSTFLIDGKQHVIATPNPEIIMAAKNDAAYRDIINRSDLSLPDGFGLLLASRLYGNPIHERITGTDLVPEIVKRASIQGKRVALVGGGSGVAQRASEALRVKFPAAHIVYAQTGIEPRDWQNPLAHEKMVEAIRASAPDVLFVAFGHPKQEQWINTYRTVLPSVKLFMGIGGALDFISGSVMRAPAWLQKIGFEWLYRFIREPRRVRRIITAIFWFPLEVFHEFLSKKKS